MKRTEIQLELKEVRRQIEAYETELSLLIDRQVELSAVKRQIKACATQLSLLKNRKDDLLNEISVANNTPNSADCSLDRLLNENVITLKAYNRLKANGVVELSDLCYYTIKFLRE